jgi:hypothetical protein
MGVGYGGVEGFRGRKVGFEIVNDTFGPLGWLYMGVETAECNFIDYTAL